MLALSLSMLLACSDSTGPAADRNQPGTGTNTMLVTADIEGQDVPGGFVTAFDVSLRDALGNPISGATVTVRNTILGTINLLELAAGSGDYEATANTFAGGDYRLSVVRGIDNVQGVVVGGISAHQISSPAANATVTANQPMTVTWSRPSEAIGVDLETRDFSAQGIPDAATYTVPAGNNPARPDQRIRVSRYNRVDIAGGLAGSRLKLSIRNTVEPVIVQ
ncbi:MAG TPA: hypothetical protein VF252_01920 [Gemmatimonadales bacterium]